MQLPEGADSGSLVGEVLPAAAAKPSEFFQPMVRASLKFGVAQRAYVPFLPSTDLPTTPSKHFRSWQRFLTCGRARQMLLLAVMLCGAELCTEPLSCFPFQLLFLVCSKEIPPLGISSLNPRETVCDSQTETLLSL